MVSAWTEVSRCAAGSRRPLGRTELPLPARAESVPEARREAAAPVPTEPSCNAVTPAGGDRVAGEVAGERDPTGPAEAERGRGLPLVDAPATGRGRDDRRDDGWSVRVRLPLTVTTVKGDRR